MLEYDKGIHACGFHRSLVFDPENAFTFEFETCPVCAAADQYTRKVAARDKAEEDKFGKEAEVSGPLSSDGRATMIRMMSPEEHAEALAKREARSATSA